MQRILNNQRFLKHPEGHMCLYAFAAGVVFVRATAQGPGQPSATYF